MRTRPYDLAEAPALARLYSEAVRELAVDHYSPAQIAQWASWSADADEFAAAIAAGTTWVAELDDELAGLAQLHPVDHVQLLYTSPRFARRGVARALYAELERLARDAEVTALTTNASRVSRALFEKEGFHVVEREIAVREGIEFERFKMMKDLD